jgi:CheY-like chemotaxis protein
MGTAYTVALVGFSQTESATFESFFRLAARRPPAYEVQEEVLDAQILVVNADNAQALGLVRDAQLPGRVLLVGGHDGGTGWPLLAKPIRLVSLLGALDALVGLRSARAGAPLVPQAFAATEPFKASQLHGLDASMRLASGKAQAAPLLAPAGRSRRRNPETEFPPTRPLTREERRQHDAALPARAAPSVAAAVPTPAPARAAPPAASPPAAPAAGRSVRIPLSGLTDFAGLDELFNVSPPAPRTRHTRSARDDVQLPEAARGDALLVGQSLVEGRILLKRFRKYELVIDWCREPAQAQAMLDAHPYRLVVIDRLGGNPDAFAICRAAKQRKSGRPVPVVILFAPSAGSMDRMKAGLAGADAYLSRSVGEADLYKVLAHHHLVNLNGFAPTNVGNF